MQQWQVPGLAIAVVKDDKVVFAKGYGTRTAGKKEPVDKDTLFAIASMSKYITATSLAMLAAEGVISFDEPIVKYLPNFKVKDPLITQQVTIRDILSHRTGLQRADFAWGTRPSLTRKELLSLLQHLDTEKPFRDSYLYNNLLYMAAGEVIPAVTGDSWDTFVKRRIFSPLGMARSNTSIDDFSGVDNIASPHAVVEGELVSVPYLRVNSTGPAGSINSSVWDMAQWFRLQLNGGIVDGRELIPEKLLNNTRTVHNPLRGSNRLEKENHNHFIDEFTKYGLGISVNESNPYLIYGHGGGLIGMSSFNVFVPEHNLGVVVHTNRANEMAYPLVGMVLNRYLGNETKGDMVDLFMIDRQAKALKGQREIASFPYNPLEEIPSLEDASYGGVYVNDLMGKFVIEESVTGALEFYWGEIVRGELVHLNANTFVQKIVEPRGISDLKLTEDILEFTNIKGRSAHSFILDGYTFKRMDK